MSDITALSIDLAKNVFQLHGTNIKGKAILKKKLNRGKLSDFVAKLTPCNIYMEACASSNYWGRKFVKYGHKVKLINPRYVKPYVKRNKNDVNDAAAIAAAARDPDMKFCEVKTECQQDIQSIHRIRNMLIRQRTALANQSRGLLAEYGVTIPKGVANIRKKLPDILGNNPKDMSSLMLSSVEMLYNNIKKIDEQITSCDKQIKELFASNERCKQLATIPGIGELGATILESSLGSGVFFKNGRHFAAFLGLVPKQHSSGGKERLLGISKGGDTYIRTLLIHGARAVLRYVDKKTDKQSIWLKTLIMRKGKNKAAVALANKIARTAWAIIKTNSSYKVNHKHIFLKEA